MDDLISEFIGETSESLALLDRELAELNQNPSDPAILATLLKFLHTIKSASGFLQLPRLESVSQAGERMLTQLRDGTLPLTSDSAALVFKLLDRIRGLIEHLANQGSEAKGDDSDLIAKLTAKPAAKSAKPSTDMVMGSTMPTVSKSPVEEPKSAPVPTATPSLDHALLDQWMEMVGELVNTRNQLQHAVGKSADETLQAPLQHLSSITTTLRESVLKARAQARSNSPELAITTLLVFEAAGQYFALPQTHIAEIIRGDAARETGTTLRVRDRELPYKTLNELLQQKPVSGKGEVIVIRAGSSDFALRVDAVHEPIEAVVRPMSQLLQNIPLYAGTALLGDARILLVLDAQEIAARFGVAKSEITAAPSTTPLTSFLLFTTGQGAPKAVALEDVLQLTTVDAATVKVGCAPYENGEIELVTVTGGAIPDKGEFDVIVLSGKGATVGLVVSSVVDIMQAPPVSKPAAHKHCYLGSTMIAGEITDVVDAAFLIEQSKKGVRA